MLKKLKSFETGYIQIPQLIPKTPKTQQHKQIEQNFLKTFLIYQMRFVAIHQIRKVLFCCYKKPIKANDNAKS